MVWGLELSTKETESFAGETDKEQSLIFQGGIYSHHNGRVLQRIQEFSLPFLSTVCPAPALHETETILEEVLDVS